MNTFNNCQFVSSKGLMQLCDHIFSESKNSGNTFYNIDVNGVKNADSLYVCAYTLPQFLNLLTILNCSIVLVTGDSDNSIVLNDITKNLLLSPKIIAWYAQNCMISHPKLVHMPIGMDYHTMAWRHSSWGPQMSGWEQEQQIKELIQNLGVKPLLERKCKIYSTFHFVLDRGDRREAYKEILTDLIDYEEQPISRYDTHKRQLDYAFVASPFGGGPDCHRTWEALILGCIPIVKSSGMNPLFEGLPVLIINKWSDLNLELLEKTRFEFSKIQKFENLEKLQLEFWKSKFKTF
jgi:hypothetical protein